MCATSAMLCAHHLFACWNGDRRLKDKWGERADVIKDTTSIVPFAAIISGKQQVSPSLNFSILLVSYVMWECCIR